MPSNRNPFPENPIDKLLREQRQRYNDLQSSTAERAIRDIVDSPVQRAIKALTDSPVQRAIRDVQESPVERAMREVTAATEALTSGNQTRNKVSAMSRPSPPTYRLSSSADLGSLVRRARKRMKMSQQQFADAAGVGRRFLSELENGKPSLEFDKVLKCALGAGIDILAKPRIPL